MLVETIYILFNSNLDWRDLLHECLYQAPGYRECQRRGSDTVHCVSVCTVCLHTCGTMLSFSSYAHMERTVFNRWIKYNAESRHLIDFFPLASFICWRRGRENDPALSGADWQKSIERSRMNRFTCSALSGPLIRINPDNVCIPWLGFVQRIDSKLFLPCFLCRSRKRIRTRPLSHFLESSFRPCTAICH